MAEGRKQYFRKIRENEKSILKNALILLSQDKPMSAEENVILRKAERIKDKRLNIRDKMIQYRQKRKAAFMPEEIEAMRLKKNEQARQFRQEQREKEDSVLKKALDLLSQNKEMSFEENAILGEAEEVKAKRLKKSQNYKKFIQKRKAEATPEKIEALRLKKLEQVKLSRKKRRAAATPEEKEALRLKHSEQARIYKQRRREKEQIILKNALDFLSQNKVLSSEEHAIVTKAEEIKARRLKKSEKNRRYRQNRGVSASAEEVEAKKNNRLDQRRQYGQTNREREESILRQASELLRKNQAKSSNEIEILRLAGKIKLERLRESEDVKLLRMINASGKLRTGQVCDEIKIEKEVIQETTINAIPANSNYLMDMQEGGYNDSSCSWLDHSEKCFMTGETSQNHSYFQSFHGGRKLSLEKSFRCMRQLIDATAKHDGHVVFGEQIAQKLRSSMKNTAEVDVAKQLIDAILQNLTIGVYSIDTKIV